MSGRFSLWSQPMSGEERAWRRPRLGEAVVSGANGLLSGRFERLGSQRIVTQFAAIHLVPNKGVLGTQLVSQLRHDR